MKVMFNFGMFTELNTGLTKGMAKVNNLGLTYENLGYDYAKEDKKFRKIGRQFYRCLNTC